MFAAGVILSCFYISSLILVALGAFVGFSSTSALIDPDKKRVRFSKNFFWIIHSGKWIPVEPSMKIGIRESNLTYRSYSWGNRALDLAQNDFRLVLFDRQNREIMPLKKTGSLEAARAELEAMLVLLGLTKV